MNTLSSIFHLMRADFLERVRSYRFLVVMALTVLGGYLLVPPFGAPYTSFVIGSHRGYYNSPWVGTIYGVVACTWLALFGFYLVKNTVERDNRTRVGQIISSTPVRKLSYTFGKWLSNLAVLSVILMALTLMAPIMQYVRAEESYIDVGKLVAPIWLMGFPALALVSALALLFECIPLLHAGLGNVVYFFIWGPILVGSTVGSVFLYGPDSAPRNDFGGLSRSLIDIQAVLEAGDYDANQGVTGVVGPVMDYPITRFKWDGISWTADIWSERAIWFVGAAFIALAAAIPFDRFDPARQGRSTGRKMQRKRPPVHVQIDQEQVLPQTMESINQEWGKVQFESLKPTFGLRGFYAAFMAELRLMFKGLPWAWYLVAAGLIGACIFSPLNIVRSYLLPIAWLWPVLIWSQMGNREQYWGVWQMVFTAPQSAQRQLSAMWLAGFFMTALTGSGAAIKFVSEGAWMSLFAWAAGALFIPALALMFGVWTKTRRVFEMVYLLWWYIAFNSIAALDFIGTTQGALDRGNPWVFLGLALVFWAVAWIGRQRQLQG